MKKNDTIYAVKCIGIFLIVMIHVLETHYRSYSILSPFNSMSESFAMPMFMGFSGYVLAKKDLSDYWFSKKIPKLIAIIIVSVIIFYIFAKIFPDLTLLSEYFRNNLGQNIAEFLWNGISTGFGMTVSWYLFVMLQCYVFLWMIQKISNKIQINKNILIAILIIVINILPYYNMGFNDVKWYGSFMLIGYVIGEHKERFKNVLWISYIAILIFAIVGYLTNWMTNWQDFEYGRGGYTIIAEDVINGKFALLGVMIGLPVISSLAIIGISRIVIKIKYLKTCVIYLGSSTLGIYLIHPLFTGISDNIWIAFFSDIIICIVGYYVLKKLWNKINLKRKVKEIIIR